ncbi:GNAT family N-acetyltransferase [Agarivorans gilvus]|uniref:GNAT family N-acetyltransferase n=1 Tax=Agarivorans gilvus TaxID=680279 RepID=UPI002FF6B9AA
MEGALVCVASVYIDAGSARLRKFATLEEFQNRGIGTALLQHMIEDSKSLHVKKFWFDARESAIEFYRRFGFSMEGGRFFKSEIAYFKMAKSLVA